MEEQKTNSHTQGESVMKIDKVEHAEWYHESSGSKEWVGALKEFDILGVAAIAYAQTLAYKLECKRLDDELKRIEAQSKFATHTVDRAFKLKMKELEQRKGHLDNFYKTVNQQLGYLHIERMTVLKMAQIATQKAMSDDTDFQTKKNCTDMAIEMTKQIPLFGDKANESLKKLVDALPSVRIQTGLLTDQ